MNPYDQLLKDIGSNLNLSLRADARQACRIEFSGGPAVQIDLEGNGDEVLFGANLGMLTPGIYRERIFKQALRANGIATVPRGTLAYSEKNNNLVLFHSLSLSNLSQDKLNKFFYLFQEHARIWHEAIKRGEIPDIDTELPERNF